MLQALKGWSPAQKKVVLASFLGWMLDAFDFFVLVFVLTDVAKEFGVGRESVALAITLTLALRPLGAFVFGRLADRFGRRPILMFDVALYSVLGLATAFAPNLAVFLILRALFGIAMGGEWGIGASLTMETVRPESRGVVSGILQSGYPTGYLLASVVYRQLFDVIGWRGMFMLSLLPAVLVLYIRRHVPESPGWTPEGARSSTVFQTLREHWKLALYAVVLMTAFNFFSHGTQDMYPTFLRVQHGFDTQTTGSITITYLWAYSTTFTTLAIGAFLIQFCVQGAWGVIPVHLNELSPANVRATFPGTVYQLGNLIASSNALIQTSIASRNGDNYASALAGVAVGAAVVIVILTSVGREARDVQMGV